MTSRLPSSVCLAVLAFEVKAGTEFRLFPAGEFRARAGDPRPREVKAWRMDAALAAVLIAQVASTGIDYVIDYEHQTILAGQNGKEAPAAGWFHQLEWREGDGLYVVATDWTERAAGYIERREYKYISPVFEYDKRTGAVTRLLHVGLTNNPALDFQSGVAEAVAAKFSVALNHQESEMNELLKKLLGQLGLQETATEAEATAALSALKATADKVGGMETEVAALKSAEPDPAKFVSVAMLSNTQAELLAARNEVAALKAEGAARELDEVMTAALNAGKLLPAQEAGMREWGKKDIAALKSFVEAAPVVAPVTMQTDGKTPVAPTGKLTDAQLAVCTQMGIPPDEYLATLKAGQA